MLEHDTAGCGAFSSPVAQDILDREALSLTNSQYQEDLDNTWEDLSLDWDIIIWKLESLLLQTKCCDENRCLLVGWIVVQWHYQQAITHVDSFLDNQLSNIPGRLLLQKPTD